MKANGTMTAMAMVALAAVVVWADPNPAVDYSWNQSGARVWTNGTYWTPAAPAGGPDGAGIYVTFVNDIAVATTVSWSGTRTIGRMDLGDANGSHGFIMGSAGGTLAFNGNGGAAILKQTATATNNSITANLDLTTDLFVTNASGYNLTLGPKITGSGGIVIDAGAGSVQMGSGSTAGSNTFSGGVTFRSGTMANIPGATLCNSVVSNGTRVAGLFGTGTLTLGSGASPVTLVMGVTSSGTRQFCNNTVVAGDVTFQGPYKFILNGSQDASGNLLATPGTITLTRTSRVALNNVSGSANVELRAQITGDYGITRTGDGAGILVLGTTNTFTGDTRIESGKLQLDNRLAMQNSAFDTSGSGTTNLTFGAGVTNCTFGGLKGTNDLALPNTWTALTLNVGSNATATYSGSLGGGKVTSPYLSVIKTGPGTQFLDGTNTYRGVTTVMDGYIGGNGVISNTLIVAGGGLAARVGSVLKVQGDVDLSAAGDSLVLVGTEPVSRTVVLTYTGTRTGQFDSATGIRADYSVDHEIAILPPSPPGTVLQVK